MPKGSLTAPKRSMRAGRVLRGEPRYLFKDFFLLKSVSEQKLELARDTLINFMNGALPSTSYNAEKLMGNRNLWSLRVNKKYRVIYTKFKGNFVVVDVIPHNYHILDQKDFRVAESTIVNLRTKFGLEKGSIVVKGVADEKRGVYINELAPEEGLAMIYGGTVISLVPEQISFLRGKSFPVILHGVPGSGKTVMAKAMITKFFDPIYSTTSKVYFVTASDLLVEKMQEAVLGEHSPEEREALTKSGRLEFTTYDALIRKLIDPSLIVGFAEFLLWFNSQKFTREINPEMLYREMSIIATLKDDEYIGLGRRQSAYMMADRKAVLKLAKEYTGYLTKIGLENPDIRSALIDPNIMSVSDKIPESMKGCVVLDEGQRMLDCQLKNIFHFAEGGKFVYMGDPSQAMVGAYDTSSRTKRILGCNKRPVDEIEWDISFRCPKAVVDFASKVKKLRSKVTAAKGRSVIREVGDEDKPPGNLFFLPQGNTQCQKVKGYIRENPDFRTSLVVLNEEEKAKAKKDFSLEEESEIAIFTAEEIIGLEMPNVVLYGCLSRNFNVMTAEEKDGYLSRVFVAVTRSTTNLFILGDNLKKYHAFITQFDLSSAGLEALEVLNASHNELASEEELQRYSTVLLERNSEYEIRIARSAYINFYNKFIGKDGVRKDGEREFKAFYKEHLEKQRRMRSKEPSRGGGGSGRGTSGSAEPANSSRAKPPKKALGGAGGGSGRGTLGSAKPASSRRAEPPTTALGGGGGGSGRGTSGAAEQKDSEMVKFGSLAPVPKVSIGQQNNLDISQLFEAVDKGDDTAVSRCLGKLRTWSANINVYNNSGINLLHLAAMKGFYRIAGLLIENGADINLQDILKQNTALHHAAERGHCELVELLLEQTGIDLSIKNAAGLKASQVQIALGVHKDLFNESKRKILTHTVKTSALTLPALHAAAKNGDFEEVDRLLKAGANIRQKCRMGRTALHYAAMSGAVWTVQTLLDRGANIYIKCQEEKSVLDLRISDGVRVVLRSYVKMNARLMGALQMGDIAALKADKTFIANCNFDAPLQYEYNTALHLAVICNKKELLEFLLNQRININALNIDQETPLILAIKMNHYDEALMLVEAGADIERSNARNMKPIHLMAASEEEFSEESAARLFNALVKRGVDLNAKGEKGYSPLHYACLHGKKLMVTLLLENKVHVNAIDDDGYRADEVAREIGQDSLSELIINYKKMHLDLISDARDDCCYNLSEYVEKIDINYLDERGDSALHFAAANNSLAFLESLLSYGANVNLLDMEGSTALHDAAGHGHDSAIRILIDYGAKLDIVNGKYKTALSAAIAKGRLDTVELLLDKGASAHLPQRNISIAEAVLHGKPEIVRILLAKTELSLEGGINPVAFSTAPADVDEEKFQEAKNIVSEYIEKRIAEREDAGEPTGGKKKKKRRKRRGKKPEKGSNPPVGAPDSKGEKGAPESKGEGASEQKREEGRGSITVKVDASVDAPIPPLPVCERAAPPKSPPTSSTHGNNRQSAPFRTK